MNLKSSFFKNQIPFGLNVPELEHWLTNMEELQVFNVLKIFDGRVDSLSLAFPFAEQPLQWFRRLM